MSEEESPPESPNDQHLRSFLNAFKLGIRSASLAMSNTVSLLHRRSRPLPDPLPVYNTDIDAIGSQINSRRDNKPSSAGKTILGLAFPTVAQLALNASGSNSLSLHLVQVSMIVAFAAFAIGFSLRNVCPRVADSIDRVSSVFSLMGFFLMVSTVFSLPSYLAWIGWLSFVLCLLASLVSAVK